MTPVRELVLLLWKESNDGKDCCPYIIKDNDHCKCTSTSPNFICDTASLQLWCLDKDRYRSCIFYREQNESNSTSSEIH